MVLFGEGGNGGTAYQEHTKNQVTIKPSRIHSTYIRDAGSLCDKDGTANLHSY